MIIEALLTVVGAFLSLIMSPLHFPTLPDAVRDVLYDSYFIQSMTSGVSLFAGFTHFQFILGLFLFCMMFHVMELGYKWICWVLRKIPVLNVRG